MGAAGGGRAVLSATTTPEGLQWGWKLVAPDLTTHDRLGGRYQYHPGEWHEPTPGSEGYSTGSTCPTRPGDGLCAALTWFGARWGEHVIGECALLVVGWAAEDVLGASPHEVRVRRLWVAPQVLDPMTIVAIPGARLRDADLRYVVLRGRDMRGSDLRDAEITDADLRDTDLTDADARGADLRGTDLRGTVLRGTDLRGALLGAKQRAYALDAGARL